MSYDHSGMYCQDQLLKSDALKHLNFFGIGTLDCTVQIQYSTELSLKAVLNVSPRSMCWADTPRSQNLVYSYKIVIFSMLFVTARFQDGWRTISARKL